LWLLLLLSCFGLMVWQIGSLIKQYKSYNVITTTETIVPDALEFPEVTVCDTSLYDTELINATGISEPPTDEELFSTTENLENFIVLTSFNDNDVDVASAWKPVVLAQKEK